MLSANKMSTEVEQIGDCSMSSHKSLSLPHRLESPHPSLSHPGSLMRLFGPIILILLGTVNRVSNHLPMRYAIAPQFIRHDLPGLPSVAPQ